MSPSAARLLLCVTLFSASVGAMAVPQFVSAYREYKLTCSSCHAQPPKLNEFGEEFVKNGYSIPGMRPERTVPLSVWASGQLANSAAFPDDFRAIPNRVEVISAGRDDDSRMVWFAEWRIVSLGVQGNGSIQDRSGRFEDLFVLFDVGEGIGLQLGQFRVLSQIDVSRRLLLSEPTAFSTSVPGTPDSDSRTQSLRGFSPAGRSPAVRAALSRGRWTGAVTVPFPGEFSVPLTSEARDTASFEFEGDPKGVFLEAFLREGVDSVGVHGFFGNNDRSLYGLAAQRRVGDLWLEGGVAHAEFNGGSHWRYSLGVDWIPRPEAAAGVRFDHRQIAGDTLTATPYVSLFNQYGRQAAKLALEGQFQEGRTPRFALELSWYF